MDYNGLKDFDRAFNKYISTLENLLTSGWRQNMSGIWYQQVQKKYYGAVQETLSSLLDF